MTTPTPAQHIEVLRSMLGGYNHDIEFEPHYNALLAALAALEAVEAAEIVAYASKTAWPPMKPKQRERMIADAQYGGEFAMAARTAETFTIPLIAHPFLPADAVEVSNDH